MWRKLHRTIGTLLDACDYHLIRWGMKERLNPSKQLDEFTRASRRLYEYQRTHKWP